MGQGSGRAASTSPERFSNGYQHHVDASLPLTARNGIDEPLGIYGDRGLKGIAQAAGRQIGLGCAAPPHFEHLLPTAWNGIEEPLGIYGNGVLPPTMRAGMLVDVYQIPPTMPGGVPLPHYGGLVGQLPIASRGYEMPLTPVVPSPPWRGDMPTQQCLSPPDSTLAKIGGVLFVRILRARNLRNGDTGLFGDVSDPYVVARIGSKIHKTPVIENDLNPTWDNGNEFVFPITANDGQLQLEVMNSNVIKDSSLGKCVLTLWSAKPSQWERYTKPLKDTSSGELDFEARFDKGVDPVVAMAAVRTRTTSPHSQAVMRASLRQELIYTMPGYQREQPLIHALPLVGVRVLEIAKRTWTAALCGRMFAACGADVIRVALGEEALLALKRGRAAHGGGVYGKVEHVTVDSGSPSSQRVRGSRAKAPASKERAPQGGPDPIRESLDKAKANTVPCVLHAGKRILPMPQGSDLNLTLGEMLPFCDILLTDLLSDELDTLNLTYQKTREKYSGLVYSHVSCIGVNADLLQRGVEDSGAFFCLTGFAEELHHFIGPRGFAASTSASSLFGVTCLALMRRRCGGTGDRVELSIFRAGKLCTAVGALTGWDTSVGIPQPPGTTVKPEVEDAISPLPFDVLGAAQVYIGRSPEPYLPVPSPQYLGPLGMPGGGASFAWKPRQRELEPPPPLNTHPVCGEHPLARVSVLELSNEKNVSVATLGCLLADLGAQVTKIERTKCPDPWRKRSPELYQDLNGRKLVQQLDIPGLAAEAALYRTLADATMFLTNLPGQALDAWGLSIDRLRENFPHLVIVVVSQFGCDALARGRELAEARKGGLETHAFWELSSLGRRCFAGRAMPPGLAGLTIAQHCLAGIGVALLRQQRTGSGQLVHVGHHQAGLYARAVSEVEPQAPGASPLLHTRDGRFMRLLGRGHKPHDIWILLHAVDRRESLFDKFRGRMEDIQHFLMKMTWEDIQRGQDELQDCVEGWMYDDLAQAFLAKGVDWFCEELRPSDAESLHRARMHEADDLKVQLEELTQKHRKHVVFVENLEVQVRKLEEQHSIGKEQELRDEQRRLRYLEDAQQWIERELQSIDRRLDAARLRAQDIRNAPIPQSSREVEEERRARDNELHEVDRAMGQLASYRAALQRRHETISEQIRRPGPWSGPLLARAQVRIVGAVILKREDMRDFGDSSDHFVTVSVGCLEQRTPTITHNQRPVWNEGNIFSFDLREGDVEVRLAVMSVNKFADAVNGRARVNLQQLERNKSWTRFVERLDSGSGNTLEFQVCLEGFDRSGSLRTSKEFDRRRRELANAQRERDVMSAQVKDIDKRIEMAEYASKWLLDVGAKSAVPLSIGERVIQEVCGNRNVVTPAFLVSKRGAGVLFSKPKMQPHVVSLFPDAASAKPPKVRVKIVSATGLHGGLHRSVSGAFVVCEILGKKDSAFTTHVAKVGQNSVEWKTQKRIRDYTPGDTLAFSVFNASEQVSDVVARKEELLGWAELPSSEFFPQGFDGLLHIGRNASLRLFVIVSEGDE